jgi:acetyltransferase EpsM
MNFHDYSGDYVIFGAGGLGRELWGWIKHARDNGASKRLLAFVADDAEPGQHYDGIPVLRRDAAQQVAGGTVRYLNAVGSSGGRRKVAEGLAAADWEAGWEALTYVHESVLRGVNVALGQGVVVCPWSTLSSDCRLGEHVLVNVRCGVAHDVAVGAYSVLLGSVSLNGNVTVGEGVTVGAGALVHPGRRIGDGATVGMGSAVFTHVRAGTTVIGNPAHKLQT